MAYSQDLEKCVVSKNIKGCLLSQNSPRINKGSLKEMVHFIPMSVQLYEVGDISIPAT